MKKIIGKKFTNISLSQKYLTLVGIRLGVQGKYTKELLQIWAAESRKCNLHSLQTV